MKKLLTYTFLVIFLFGSSTLAIEKKDSKRVIQKEVEKQNVPKLKQDNQPGNLNSQNRNNPKVKRDYNDFVDRNNNGIDDRIESRKKKAKVEKKQIDKNTEKKKIQPKSKK
jgi:hypothetical protein